MRPTNPAVYECKRSADGIHVWMITDQGVKCVHCEIVLTGEEAHEVMGYGDRRL